MKVLVSACIMGENCKYNGKNNKNSAAIHFLKDKEVISICPEVLAGMETPRPCAEIVNGRVVDENGNDVSLEYNKAVAVALSKIQNEEIDLVILQSRSPTCGVNQIYDGSFTGKLVSGMGLFAKALKQKGYANGREVRNFFEKAVVNQANRLALELNTDDEDVSTLTDEDVMLAK